MSTRKEMLTKLFKENGLVKEDYFKHSFYTIITRSGIDKIQASKKINICYEVIVCKRDYCVVKAIASHDSKHIETFGSALKGDLKLKTGTTNSWYVMEMAEKRAMSRAVLKLAGFYELGAFGEEESEEFKKSKPTSSQSFSVKVNRMKADLDDARSSSDLEKATNIYEEARDDEITQVMDYHTQLFKKEAV